MIGVYVADVQDNNMLVVTSKKLDSEKTTVNHIESHLLNDQLSKFNVHTTLRVKYKFQQIPTKKYQFSGFRYNRVAT